MSKGFVQLCEDSLNKGIEACSDVSLHVFIFSKKPPMDKWGQRSSSNESVDRESPIQCPQNELAIAAMKPRCIPIKVENTTLKVC